MFLETFEDALQRRRLHRRKLELGNKRQRHAGKILRKCRRRHRCGTEACRICLREFRLWWLGEAIKVVAQRPEWTRCSVILDGLLVPYGNLQAFDVNIAVKRIRKRLERSSIRRRVVLGALDVSLNIEANVNVGWQFHLYLLVEGPNDTTLQRAIKDALPPEPTALAPYDFQKVDDPLPAVTYMYKAMFKRGSGYENSQGNHQTKDQPLKGADLRELLPFFRPNTQWEAD